MSYFMISWSTIIFWSITSHNYQSNSFGNVCGTVPQKRSYQKHLASSLPLSSAILKIVSLPPWEKCNRPSVVQKTFLLDSEVILQKGFSAFQIVLCSMNLADYVYQTDIL